LKAPMVKDGERIERDCGTPQGGVITPRTQKITSDLSALSPAGATGSLLI
jgi:hypothetical protein